MGLKAPEAPVADAGEPQCFAGNLAWLLYRAHWALATQLTAALEPLGVSPRGYHVLRAALSGERTQTEIAEMVGLDKTTMVATVDELEEAGLAERRPSPQDRRARIVAVTPKGRRKLAKADEAKERVQETVLGALEPRERSELLAALAKLLEGPFAQPGECSRPLRRRMPRG